MNDKNRALPGRVRAAAESALAGMLLLLTAAPAAAEPVTGVLGRTAWETVQRGGVVMYVILAVSVIGLAFVLEAAFLTRRGAILPARTERRLEDTRAADAVEELVKGPQKVSVNRILAVGYRWRRGSTEQIQSAIEETVSQILWKLRRALRPLGIIANTAPLLGLLGTVVGIIQAFDVVASQGALGDPAALAGGISKALLTTCFGLIVAIPMLLTYHYFVGKAESLLHKCEELAKEALLLPPE